MAKMKGDIMAEISNSILNSTKRFIGGISENDTSFDVEIIAHINTVIATLRQMGVGPEEGYSITDASNTWDDYLGNSKILDSVKTYIGLKTRMIFDPPTSSAVGEAIKANIAELEWRLNITGETKL